MYHKGLLIIAGGLSKSRLAYVTAQPIHAPSLMSSDHGGKSPSRVIILFIREKLLGYAVSIDKTYQKDSVTNNTIV